MTGQRISPSVNAPKPGETGQPRSIRGRLKQMLGPKWQFRTHRLARLRWLTKYRIVRDLQPEVGFRTKLGFVLLDPEIESYSYELADERRFIAELARGLGCSESELATYAEETRRDPELNARLARHTRWQFDVKRRLPLGHRLSWYLMVRARKPRLVVETGTYRGLGSLVLLRALERNRQEGFPGELMSFDITSASGGLVRPALRERWTRFVGSTHELLEPALEGRQVDMLFQDTPHTEENQRWEFGAALARAGGRLLLVDGSGGESPTLRSMAAQRGGSHYVVSAPSRNHVYQGGTVAFALFDRAATPGAHVKAIGTRQVGSGASYTPVGYR
jgi:predicted O-methyltransferase YrrM